MVFSIQELVMSNKLAILDAIYAKYTMDAQLDTGASSTV